MKPSESVIHLHFGMVAIMNGDDGKGGDADFPAVWCCTYGWFTVFHDGDHVLSCVPPQLANSPSDFQQPAESISAMLSCPARGVVDEFGGVTQAELLADVHAVCVHGLDTEMQHSGDFMRLLALTEKLIHLELTI